MVQLTTLINVVCRISVTLQKSTRQHIYIKLPENQQPNDTENATLSTSNLPKKNLIQKYDNTFISIFTFTLIWSPHAHIITEDTNRSTLLPTDWHKHLVKLELITPYIA